MEDRLLRRRQVEEVTGMSRSSIYRLMQNGEFPRPVRVGPCCRQVEGEGHSYLAGVLHMAGYETGPPHPGLIVHGKCWGAAGTVRRSCL